MKDTTKLQSVLAALALGASLQCGFSQTITPAMGVPAASVNTSKPGFKMRIVQARTPTFMTAAAPAEALINGFAIDPVTNQPYENLADLSGADPDGTFYIPGFINVNQDPGGAAGNFGNDDPVPGIPGTTSSTDNYVVEFTGWLQLPAGTVRLGVNSDDGFRLTIGNGTNPRDPGALQNAILDGTRGAGNTDGTTLTVNQAGFYPFRLLWWENGGGSECELYNFAPGSTSGTRYLVNDSSQANSIKSFAELTTTPPAIFAAAPYGGQTGVAPAPYMTVNLADGKTTVAAASIQFLVDGKPLTPAVNKSGTTTTVSAQAPTFVANTVHTNSVIFADSAGASYTNTWTYTISNYPTIPAEYSLASVDTSKPGFRSKVYQIDVNRNPATGIVPNAERQIAAGYIDPATGKPYPNTADTGPEPDGYFVIPGVYNVDGGDGGGIGNFDNGSPVPGITGSSPNTTDRYVNSVETILQLKAGPYRLGVNSDDGFRLSAGRGVGDVVGIQLGTAGDRAAADTFMDFVVAADGNYPFRLMWWETGGGSSCEFYVIELSTGIKTLINDANGKIPIKAFRESAASRPYISKVLPTVNYGYTFADDDMTIDVTDGAIAANAGSFVLTLNNVAQTVTSAKSGKVTTLTRKGSLTNLLPSGTVSARLVYTFTEAGSTVSATNNWSFIVPAYTRPIPAANKVLASQVSGSGFKVRGYQMDKSKDASQGNGGRHTGNNMPGPEIEFDGGYLDYSTGKAFPNLLDFSTANPDGTFDVPDVLNFNHSTGTGQAANAGIFNLDMNVPGMPGTGSSNLGLDNTVHEFQTYLDLKAGAYLFGLNVDDGWTCISAPNPRDTLGTLLGFRNGPGGQNGNPANNPNAAFNVVVPEDGIYPFRILFWEGGGGVNMEFFAIDRQTGTQILVNDLTGQAPSVVGTSGQLNSAIKAYSTYSGPVRPWTKFSVYPMPNIGTTEPVSSTGGAVTLWQNRDQQGGPGPIKIKTGLLNGSWNSGEIQNSSTATKPYGDSVGAIVADLGSGTVGMVLDGANVTPTVTTVAGTTDKLVLYTPPTPLSPTSNHVAGLVYAGTTNYWTFSVMTFTNVAAGTALPSSAADPNAVGFHVKVAQAAGTSTLANTVARAEGQLAGNPANVAIAGPNSDGSYTVPGIINWNQRKNPGATGAEIGNFQTLLTGTPDEPIPGVPGTGAALLNIAAEIFAYLDLPAGYQKFGVNGDDGWKVQIGTPGQTNGTVLFTIDRGAGAQNIPFAFVTPAAGLYPVRLVWYQGGGDANLEFFTVDSDNTKIPVNDRKNPKSVKAYYNVIGTTGEQPKITNVKINTDGTLTVEWTGGGTLESAPAITGPWTGVAGASSPYTFKPTGQTLFGRIKK